MTTTGRPRWTFAITCAALFIFALDRLVVVTALPAIRADLGAGIDDLEWTVNAYTLTFAVLLLTGAALGDRFGRRRMFLVGLSVFTAGSALAALAPSMTVLVLARAVQGVGGAILTPLTLTILSASVPPHRRGAVIGAWGGVGSVGAALGPVAGGWLTDTVGWQGIFWLNVPIGLLLLPAARWRLAESFGPPRRLDLPGVALVSAGLFGLVWGVIRGGGHGWSDPTVLLGLAAGALALVAFVRWERRSSSPMLPLRLLRDRVFATASVASVLMYSASFGTLFLLAQLLQTGLGASPLEAGLRTVPMAMMPVFLAPLGGALCDRLSNRPLMIVALSLEVVAFAWLALVVRPGVGYAELLPALILMGAGLPLFWAPIANASLGAALPQEQGQASGVATAVRELAIVFGVAVLASTFAAHGDYASPPGFVAGFVPAMWLATGLVTAGVLVASALPRSRLVGEPGGRRAEVGQAVVNRPANSAANRSNGIAGRPATLSTTSVTSLASPRR
jgi:EmrB/QacA subfamily drug resistance transporter